MFTLAISGLTTSNLPWFREITFQVPAQYCCLQNWTLLSSPDTSIVKHHFQFGPAASFFLELSNCPPLFSSSILDTFQPGGLGLIFWCHIFLPFLLMGFSRILKGAAISPSSGLYFVRTLHPDPSMLSGTTQHGSQLHWVTQAPSPWQGCDPWSSGREEAETELEGCSGVTRQQPLGLSSSWPLSPDAQTSVSPVLVSRAEAGPELWRGQTPRSGSSWQHIPDAAAHAGLCTVMPPAGNVFNRWQRPLEPTHSTPVCPGGPWPQKWLTPGVAFLALSGVCWVSCPPTPSNSLRPKDSRLHPHRLAVQGAWAGSQDFWILLPQFSLLFNGTSHALKQCLLTSQLFSSWFLLEPEWRWSLLVRPMCHHIKLPGWGPAALRPCHSLFSLCFFFSCQWVSVWL